MKKLLLSGIISGFVVCIYAAAVDHRSASNSYSAIVKNPTDTLPDTLIFRKKPDTIAKLKTFYRRDINWKNKPDSLANRRRKDSTKID